MARLDHRRYPKEVRAILAETGQDSPEEAIRQSAQSLIRQFTQLVSDGAPPFNMEALASLRSIRKSDDPPKFSKDAEIVPDGDRGMIMRLNSERPQTRQRFSIGHEIGHTLFPGYSSTVHCRKGINRDWSDPKDLIENLCDVAASEFLFPEPWFHDAAQSIDGKAAELIALAQTYLASPEATVRRFVEVRDDPEAVIFFRWKHKPSEKKRADGKGQKYIFGSKSAFEPERKLRVEYSISNKAFDQLGIHIPAHKSVEEDCVILQASRLGDCMDATEDIDLGPLAGRYYIWVFPIFTADSDVGPKGERSVAAVISPANKKRRRRQPR